MASGTNVGVRIVFVCIALVGGAIKASMHHSSYDSDYSSANYHIDPDVLDRALAAHRPTAVDETEQVAIGSSLAAGQIFDPKAFAKAQKKKKTKKGKKVPPPSAEDIGIDYDGEPGAVESLRTEGLAAFGVPEVVIHDVPAVLDDAARTLLFATADTILAGTAVDEMGSLAVSSKAEDGVPAVSTTVQLASEGDRIAIVFPGSKAKVTDRVSVFLQQWQPAEAGGSQTFEESSQVLFLESKARREIRALAASWPGGKVPRHEVMTVEAPFPTQDGTLLYLAMDVERIQGETITGVLASSPSQNLRDGLGVGSRVETMVDKVLDYSWMNAEGKEQGGEVDALLDKEQGPVPTGP
jgi:hypothetical protein